MFIKFALRRNLIYPLQYIIWSFARDLLLYLIINNVIKFQSSLIYLPLMFLGEILAGAIIYFYEKKIMKTKKEEKQDKYFMAIKLIEYEKEEDDYFVPKDSKIKIIFLIFLSALFDFVQFELLNKVFHHLKMLSDSFSRRLNGFSTIFSSFFYVYALKLPVYKHHKISLSIIGICLIIVIIIEYIFGTMKAFVTSKYLTISVVLIIVTQILSSCMDSLEKYLFEYDFMDPFVVLMYQGIFGFLLCFLLFINPEYIEEIKEFISKKNEVDNGTKYIVGLIFSLFFYVVFSGGKNLFRVVTNKIYSPMTKTLSDYFLNPIYLVFFCINNDFKINGTIEPWYFSINLIMSLIISFFGCVYNEIIILFFCHLESETYAQISRRASSSSLSEMTELVKFDNDSDEDEEIDNSTILSSETKYS